jgi:hypothetical protein
MAMRIDEAVGVITDTELMGGYRRLGSRLQGHRSPVLSWVDVASGSLAQGIGNGVGVALAAKFLDKSPFHVWVLCGDSETTEGSVWEALDLVANKKLAWTPMSKGIDDYLHWVHDVGSNVHPDSAKEYIYCNEPENPQGIVDFAAGQGGKAYGVPRRMKVAMRRRAFGEIEARADVDTLANEDDDSTHDFHHYVGSPEKLKEPDLDRAVRIDRQQENRDVGSDRRSEDVEDIDPDRSFVDEDEEHAEVIDDSLDWCDSNQEKPSQETLRRLQLER